MVIRRTNQNVPGEEEVVPWYRTAANIHSAGHGVSSASDPDTRSLSLLLFRGAHDYLEFLTGFSTLGWPRICLGNHRTFLGFCFMSQIDLCNLIPSPSMMIPASWWFLFPCAHQLGASTNVQCGSDTAMPTLTKGWSERRFQTPLMDSLDFKNTLAQRVKTILTEKGNSSPLPVFSLPSEGHFTQFLHRSHQVICVSIAETRHFILAPHWSQVEFCSVKAPRSELKLISWPPCFLILLLM